MGDMIALGRHTLADLWLISVERSRHFGACLVSECYPLKVVSLFPPLQCAISVLPCSAGTALPIHLAAHLHSCAASQHAGC